MLQQFSIYKDIQTIYNIINRCYVFCSVECQLIDTSRIEDLKKINNIDLKAITTAKRVEIGTKGLYSYVNSGSTRDEKFQESMKKDAERLKHAEKREKYKKHMRNPSSKSSLSSGHHHSNLLKKTKLQSGRDSISKTNDKTCKARTKKGERCTNKIIKGSEYCGILSHKELSLGPQSTPLAPPPPIEPSFFNSSTSLDSIDSVIEPN
jgi:hypothetical protein